jgi:hypothetical protein
MAFSKIYQLPVDITRWTFDGNDRIAFSWQYEDDRSALLALYEDGKNRHWDAGTRLDWSQELAEDNPLGMDDATIPIYGTSFWRKMGEHERGWLRRNFQAHLLSQLLHGEQGALMAAAKIAESVPYMTAKLCAAMQMVDEARHVEALRRLVHDKVKIAYPIAQPLRVLLDHTLTDRRWDFAYLGLQVISEGLALAVLQYVRDNASNPLAAALTAYLMQDEARHGAVSHAVLRDYYLQLSAPELDEREDFAIGALAFMRERLGQNDVWIRAGVPVAEARDHVLNSARMQAFRTGLCARVVPLLREIGLFSPRVQKALADMGVIHYARTDLMAVRAEDERLAARFDE